MPDTSPASSFIVNQIVCVRAFRMQCPFCAFSASTPGPQVNHLIDTSAYHQRLLMYLHEHVVQFHPV